MCELKKCMCKLIYQAACFQSLDHLKTECQLVVPVCISAHNKSDKTSSIATRNLQHGICMGKCRIELTSNRYP